VAAALQIMHADAKAGWCEPALLEAFVDVLERGTQKSVA